MRLVGTNIHYVPSNEVQVPTEEATGKGLKRILPIVVGFVMPYAAPWLAAKIGLSSALSGAFGTVLGKTAAGLAGRVVGNVLTGAALGAATGTGAGAGALGGLFGSFSNAGRLGVGKSATAVAPAGTPSLSGPGSIMKTGVAPSPSTNLTPLSAGMTKPLATTTGPFRGADSAMARPVSPSGGSSGPIASAAPGTTISSSTGEYSLSRLSAPSAPPPSVGPRPPPVPGPAEASLGQRAQTALGQAGSRVMKTLTDPDTILRAGMFLATGAISGSPEEQALIQEQAEALRELRERDSQAFNMRMQLAQQAVGEASFYDPVAIANWAAAQARTSASAAAQQAERESVARGSRDTGRAKAIKRAGLFQTALGGSKAFAEGYGQGQGAKLSAIGAAAGLVPSGGGFEYAALLGQERALAEQRANARAAGMGSLFAGLTGAPRWT